MLETPRRAALATAFACLLELVALSAFEVANDACRTHLLGQLGTAPQGDTGLKGQTASTQPTPAAWLSVAGTSIDLPVMKAPAEDEDFYLTHNSFGLPDAAGTPYLDARCGPDDIHCLVYGHHIIGASNEMFSPICRSFEKQVFSRIEGASWRTAEKTRSFLPFCSLKEDQSYEKVLQFSFPADELGGFLESLARDASCTSGTADSQIKTARRCLTLATCASPIAGQRKRTLLIFTSDEG